MRAGLFFLELANLMYAAAAVLALSQSQKAGVPMRHSRYQLTELIIWKQTAKLHLHQVWFIRDTIIREFFLFWLRCGGPPFLQF